MSVSRITTRLSKAVSTQCRNSLLLYIRRKQCHQCVPILSHQYHSLRDPQSKVVAGQVSLLHQSGFNGSALQRFGFSSSASPQTNEKETAQSGNEQGTAAENDDAAGQRETSAPEDAKVSGKKDESGSNVESQSNTSQTAKRRRRVTKQVEFSDSDSDSDTDLEDLSRDDLVKLVLEKEEILKAKDEEFQKTKDKYIRAYAEIENVMARAKREAENSKKYAVQNFAKSLLDVADNLDRAASVVKDSFSKIDQSKDTAGAVPLLKTLLEGVEMTDKQLAEVFKKAGIEKYDPVNEQFDPNKHNAVFQVPDPSKAPGTVAVVLKAGYTLHDRILRPAEVGVAVAVENGEASQGSEV